MKPLRATSIVTVIAWMCGSLFALWLVFSAKTTAQLMAVMETPTWTRFLTGVPWYAVWIIVVSVLALLGWAAASAAKRAPWAAYAYAVLLVIVLAVLFWAAVVVPTGSQLFGGF